MPGDAHRRPFRPVSGGFGSDGAAYVTGETSSTDFDTVGEFEGDSGSSDAFVSKLVFLDTTPPDTRIDSGPQGTTTDNSPTFTFSSSEAGSSFECRVDGTGFAPCSGPGASHTTPELSDGAHSFQVRATDAAGNTDFSPATRAFSVDTQPGPTNPAPTNPGPTPPPTADTTVTDFDVTAKKRQKQKGRRIKVKISAAAGEAISAKAVGKIKIKGKKGSFRLKREREQIEAGERNVFRLKLAGKKKKVKRSERKIKRAIRKYNRASGKRKRKIAIKAPVRVVATDAAGNEAVEKRVVRLR